MRNSRKSNNIRDIRITPDFCPRAAGSLLFEMGNTRIICAASLSEDVPDHAASRGKGWLTAEYSMLPYSTSPRTGRPLMKKDGRSVEIQRLIGRSLRGIVDLETLAGYSITIDCDVLQADGGTRTASISGGFIALKMCIEKMLADKLLTENPIKTNVAAVSVGIIDGETMLDLDYAEDSRADVDMNVVMDGTGSFIEVQGTGEGSTFSREEMDSIIDLAAQGIKDIIEIQNRY